MTRLLTPPYPAGRADARRFLVAAVVSLCVVLPGARLTAAADLAPSPQVTVQEERGLYTVTARFTVAAAPEAALAVLADYEQIPRFMPDVRKSLVLESTPGHKVVEQEAQSSFLMFSKKVHLLLEVTESGDSIRFIDRCGRSFTTYEGSWRATRTDGRTLVSYELTAKPAFEVPRFILKRLLKQDAADMIKRLQQEIDRVSRVTDPSSA